MSTKQIGDAGEKLALQYLQQQGFRLVARNFRCRQGEIDLIMAKDRDLIFVEVRSKSRIDYGIAEETIDYKKQRKIRYTAQYFLQQNPHWENYYCRFDVIAIRWNKSNDPMNTNRIDWYQNAFQ